MQTVNLTPLQALLKSVLLVAQAAPIELRNLVLLNLVTGASPATLLFFGKVVIDETSLLLKQGVSTNVVDTVFSHPILLWSMIAIIFINLLLGSLYTFTVFVVSKLEDRIEGSVKGRVLHKIATFDDIALFENPQLLNIVQLAEKSIEKLQQLTFTLSTMLTGFFALVPVVLYCATIAWWVPCVLFLASTPSIWVQMHYRKKIWGIEATQAPITRQMNLYAKVMTDEAYAKELRLYKLQPLLLERWNGYFQQSFNEMQQIRKRGTLAVIAWSFISGFGTALPYVYVVSGVLRGVYTLGDLALYAGLIFEVRRSLIFVIASIAQLYDIALGTSPIFQLLQLKPQLQMLHLEGRKNTNSTKPNLSNSEIQLKNVSFAYPGSDKKVLEDINLTIQPGEMIALVGENGAGKTTFAKLLCRLYDPQSGAIEWNGQDLRSFELDALRERIAVVTQDYARFPVAVRENIAFGKLSQLDDNHAINSAAKEAGIAAVIERLPEGLDTILGKQLDGGVDLSGGQWQRIAIARALMRRSQAELLIFDEPTAALDPKTEHEIYNIFRAIASEKITVIVSHRLALAKMADRIVVMENAKILEIGTHDELMVLGGQYSIMFNRQASSYV